MQSARPRFRGLLSLLVLCLSVGALPHGVFALSLSANAPQQTSTAAITLVYSELPGDVTSAAPGLPGVSIIAIDRVAVSPDGASWILTLLTDLAGDQNECVIVNGSLVAREGTTASYLPPGRRHGFMDRRVAILDDGRFVFSGDLDGSTQDDDVLFVGNAAGQIAIVEREGSPIQGAPAGHVNGSIEMGVLTAAGYGYEANNVTGAPGTDNVIMLNGSVLVRAQIDIPATVFSGGGDPWEDFDPEGFHVSEDGAHYLLKGTVQGAQLVNGVLAIDGTVMVMEGRELPGGNIGERVNDQGIESVYMSPGGEWMAHGHFSGTGVVWAIRNGLLIAHEGDPIHSGAPELLSRPIFASTCNDVGSFVIGCATDALDPSRNEVLILNGERVLVREGDPIDVDGNGWFDDDVFIDSFGDDDIVLTDSGILHFVGTVRDGSGLGLGHIYAVLDTTGTIGSPFCTAQLNSTGAGARISGQGSTQLVDNDVVLVVQQLPVASLGYYLNSIGVGLVPMAGGSTGDLCIASPSVGRHSANVLSANAQGRVSLDIDVNAVPTPLGSFPLMPGETRYWQYWYRDSTPMGVPTSNFSNALALTVQ